MSMPTNGEWNKNRIATKWSRGALFLYNDINEEEKPINFIRNFLFILSYFFLHFFILRCAPSCQVNAVLRENSFNSCFHHFLQYSRELSRMWESVGCLCWLNLKKSLGNFLSLWKTIIPFWNKPEINPHLLIKNLQFNSTWRHLFT